MHRYLSLGLLLAWLLAALAGIRLAGFVHLLPVLAAIIEMMHLLTGGGSLSRRSPQRRCASAPTHADGDRRLGSSGRDIRPATSGRSTMSRLGDRYRFNPNAPLSPPLLARPRDYYGSYALAAHATDVERPAPAEAGPQPSASVDDAQSGPSATTSPAPPSSAAGGDDDRMRSQAAST
ncbi:MAG: hypothetical protein ACOVKS_13050 [Aquimonas sp.]|jgi:hypothetical protein